MKVTIEGNPKEIADFVLGVQNQPMQIHLNNSAKIGCNVNIDDLLKNFIPSDSDGIKDTKGSSVPNPNCQRLADQQ